MDFVQDTRPNHIGIHENSCISQMDPKLVVCGRPRTLNLLGPKFYAMLL